MKIAITLLFLVSAFSSWAANEKKNLAILMMNGSVKMSSLEEKLNGKQLGHELADGMLAKAENKCDEPRSVSSDDNHIMMRFEDCVLTIKKKKSVTVAIQYQIRTKVKNGKSKSILRKKTLKASTI
jgi:hypothetical protein